MTKNAYPAVYGIKKNVYANKAKLKNLCNVIQNFLIEQTDLAYLKIFIIFKWK